MHFVYFHPRFDRHENFDETRARTGGHLQRLRQHLSKERSDAQSRATKEHCDLHHRSAESKSNDQC